MLHAHDNDKHVVDLFQGQMKLVQSDCHEEVKKRLKKKMKKNE